MGLSSIKYDFGYSSITARTLQHAVNDISGQPVAWRYFSIRTYCICVWNVQNWGLSQYKLIKSAQNMLLF